LPSAQEILDGLSAITNDWRGLATLWHVAFGAGVAAFVLGWRPLQRLAGALFSIPLVSVSALAWVSGNPFNGTVCAILAAGLGWQAFRLRASRVVVSAPWLVTAGGLLAAFGWAYPHFLEAESWAAYFYAAPLGLIPCPTLSALVGAALVVGGFGSRSWSLTLAAAGALYGLVGWLGLGVTIDVGLLAGAALLGVASMSPRGRAAGAVPDPVRQGPRDRAAGWPSGTAGGAPGRGEDRTSRALHYSLGTPEELRMNAYGLVFGAAVWVCLGLAPQPFGTGMFGAIYGLHFGWRAVMTWRRAKFGRAAGSLAIVAGLCLLLALAATRGYQLSTLPGPWHWFMGALFAFALFLRLAAATLDRERWARYSRAGEAAGFWETVTGRDILDVRAERHSRGA